MSEAPFVADPFTDAPSEEQTIAAEKAEAERVRALGPITTGVTAEQLENNPSDYHPERSNPSVMVEAAQPAVRAAPADSDERQQWVCVGADGVRSAHKPFRSDAHLLDQLVRCPECSGISVRKVDPGESVT